MSGFKRWLQELSLEKYEAVLSAQDIDLEVAHELTEHDLEKLGLSLGHRRKFIAAAARLRKGAAGASSANTARPPRPAPFN